MRVAIYTRVSSEEQVEGYSLSAQAEAVYQFAKQRGWQVVRLYEERGRSGKNALRPEFQQMIRDAEAKLFDVVAVHKLDRFSRSLADVVTYVPKLEENGVSFVSVTESYDMTTPAGKMMVGLLALLAQWYLDNLSQETTKGKRERARRGGWNGSLPFGYTTLRRMRLMLSELGTDFKAGKISEADYSQMAELLEKEIEKHEGQHRDTDALPCPINRAGVVLAFEKYSLGVYSDADIGQILTHAGYRTMGSHGHNPFGADTIKLLLQNRFYIGETSYQGIKKGAEKEYIPGSHAPILSVELFDKCQEVRMKRAAAWSRGAPNQIEVYPLASLLICLSCGSKWRGWHLRETRRYRDPAKNRGLDCPTDIKSVPAEILEDQAANILLNLDLPQDWHKRAVMLLTKDRPRLPSVKIQQSNLQTKLERLKQLFVMGDISEAEYKRMRDDLQSQSHILSVPVTVHSNLIDMERVIELLGDIKQL